MIASSNSGVHFTVSTFVGLDSKTTPLSSWELKVTVHVARSNKEREVTHLNLRI